MKGAECVVIAGDPQQLPPTVSAPQAVAAQLDRTVFERLQVRHARLCCAQPTLIPRICPAQQLTRGILALHRWHHVPLITALVPGPATLSCPVPAQAPPCTQACGLQPWLLDTQYRMHPAIAEFPSQLFYKGLIQTGLSAEDRPLPPGRTPLSAAAACTSQHANHALHWCSMLHRMQQCCPAGCREAA